MSETRFNLRRLNRAPDANVESSIDRGTAAMPQEETSAGEPAEKIRRPVVLLPNGSHREFKQLAAARETTMSDLCRAWIEEAELRSGCRLSQRAP